MSTAAKANEIDSGYPLSVQPSSRPLPNKQIYFVATNGSDSFDGGINKPWKTVSHAVRQLTQGDTLVLRSGTYYEEITLSLQGTADAPITLRSYPGEVVTLSGAIPEFQLDPANSWEPVADAPGSVYRATRRFPNLRAVMGRLGDTNQGLVTHLHQQDFLATNQMYRKAEGVDPKTVDFDPVYLGPGLWYNAKTGELFARLDHTTLPEPITNYQGQTDPRKIPLIISPFHALPLKISGSEYLTLQDITITGGGYDTIDVQQSDHIKLDRVNIYAGTYGLRAKGLTNFEMLDSVFLGNCPPWHFRSDNSLRARPGSIYRDLARYNTHALIVTDGAQEFSVFAIPVNDAWNLHHNIFAQAHDGLYLGGISTQFNHNLVTDMQDDGIYLSPMYRRIGLDTARTNIQQNLFGACATALAFGGPSNATDILYIYRNVFDLRGSIPYSRPTQGKPFAIATGKPIGDHGSPPWPDMYVYNNTFIQSQRSRLAMMYFDAGMRDDTQRQLFNNIFYHQNNLPGFGARTDKGDLRMDGNLYWSPAINEKASSTFFNRFRATPAFKASQTARPQGSTSISQVADPRLTGDPQSASFPLDTRPTADSPLINAGVELPSDWPDPLGNQDVGLPDIGALPLNVPMFEVGPRPSHIPDASPLPE